MNSDDKDRTWLKCQWNGEASGWPDFLRCVRLAFEKTSRRKRHLLGPEIVGQLSGRAWVVTQELDHRRLVRRDGVVYLIEFLRDRLCKTPIPDVGLRLEQLMIRLRRHPGTSMATWATQLRDAYRQLQVALARARKGQGVSTTSSAPSTPAKPRSSRRTSQETLEEPHAEAETDGEREETETLLGPPDEEELQPEAGEGSPFGRLRDPRSPRRKRKDSDSDDSLKALADLEIWNRYEEKLEDVLPSELLGWLLLRRAGLSAQARLSVQAASGNTLALDRIELALRGMEDELLAQEHSRGPPPPGRRRSYWVEEEGHWSILLADAEDLQDSLEGIPLHYVGDESLFHVWPDAQESVEDSWPEEAESTYWGEDPGAWPEDEDPTAFLTAEELQQVDEAYQVAEGKLRSFMDARRAVRARHLSRGFYPFSPQSKGFKKGKGKGKGFRPSGKGKTKMSKGMTPSSPTSTLSLPVLMSEASTFAVGPGQAGYSGCFICGDRGHQFRVHGRAPRAESIDYQSIPFDYAIDYQSIPLDYAVDYQSIPVDFAIDYQRVLTVQESVAEEPPEIAEVGDAPDMILVQKDVSGSNLDGYAVLDSGATETVGSLPALEALMVARFAITGSPEQVMVTNEAPKRFKFGNGAQDMSSSHILLPVTLGQQQVPMGIFTLDVVGVPLLIGIKTLRRLCSVLDCHRGVLVMGAVDPHRGIKLMRSGTGHLLLDLRQDLMVHSFSLLDPYQKVSSSCVPHREETSFMVQSVQLGAASSENVNHVDMNADASGLEEGSQGPAKTSELKVKEKSEAKFEAPSGAAKTKAKKSGYAAPPLDWDRTVEADPRDPRHQGPPCHGEHKAARMFKGSPSGSNQYGQWIACERCLLRLSYTPRAGCHALHRSPGALPKDVTAAVAEELPGLDTLKDKDIGWAAAEKSAEDNLTRIKQVRASQKGAAPKRGNPKALAHKVPVPETPTPTSGTSSVMSSPATSHLLVDHEEISEGMQATPGVGVCREEQRKTVNYAILENEENIEALAETYNMAKDYSMNAMEDLLGQLRAAHAVPQRKFMTQKNSTSFSVSYGLYAHGSQSGIMNSTFQNPRLCQFVNRWLRHWAPSTARWTTFSILYNVESRPHRDLHNLRGQPNFVITFGPHEHGELWLEKQPEEPETGDMRARRKPSGSLAKGRLLSPYHRVVDSYSDQWHATMPWTGTRIAIAAYTVRSFRDVDTEMRNHLLYYNFPLPTTPRTDSVLFGEENSGMKLSCLTDYERQQISNDYQEFQDLLFEDFEDPESGSGLFALELCTSTSSPLLDELRARGEQVQTCGFSEGGDLGTVHGAELVQKILNEKRPHWLVCHVPKGPKRRDLQDQMTSSLWKHYNKVVRHLIEVSQAQIQRGGEVLWIQQPESSVRFSAAARTFWYHHQTYAEGRTLRCGPHLLRSTSTSLLQSTPATTDEDPGLWRHVASTMRQVVRNDAVFGLIGAVDLTALEGLTSAELGALMERVHRIHFRLGHPSNRLLIKNLQARHADKKLIAAASQLKCDACLESRVKAPRPPVDLSRSDRLWTDLQMDLFHMKIDNRIYHFLLFVDECSGYAVIRLVFEHPASQGGNATSAQICHLLEEAWTQYFGYPERIKLDAESALRGALLRDWCSTRGVELVHAPAEHHQFISEVERSIGTLRRKIEVFIRERPEQPRQVALSMVTAHNSMARIHGFSPLQWTLGRDMSLSGHVNESPGELSALSSAGTPGSDLHQVQRLRLEASKVFLEARHKELGDRAARSAATAYPHFLPGDLIYYRRYKTPSDLPANASTDHPRMSISRWFGPGRVLATETRGAAGERRPSSHLWIIAQGRLKKCHYTQVRAASEAEQLIAQQSTGVTFPWTMSNLTSLLNKGAYEDLTRDQATFPDDLEFPDEDEEAPPVPEAPPLLPPDGPPSDEEMIPVPKAEAAQGHKRRGPEVNEDEEMIPGDENIDLNKLFNDPEYMPFQPIPEHARIPSSSTTSFREQRARHEQEDRPWHVSQTAESNLYYTTDDSDKAFAVTIDAPSDAQAWKRMVKNPEKFMSKAVSKGVEVSWHKLSPEQRRAMGEAKSLEVAQWVQLKVCKKVAELVPEHQLLRMRWVLTFKEAPSDDAGKPQVKAKARIVILGFSDPGLLEDSTASPTMSKLTRQLMLNMACIKKWQIFSADVRTAFLQARPADRGRRLLAKPLPELAEEMNLSPQECVELTGSAYGLATAPKEWFTDVAGTIKRLGGIQCRTDPCAWIILGEDNEVAGVLASHVDDFLIMGSATDKNWLDFIANFKQAYTWAPWEHSSFSHCGIRLVQHEDWSITMDHSSFCSDLVQMDPVPSGESMDENHVRQAKAILGSVQWRVTQSAPHHAAKLGFLQTLVSSRDGSCVEQINKLVREVHSAKHIGVQVQNLGDFDAKAAVFVAWTDASLANRSDGSSTGGMIIGMMNPKAVALGQGKVNVTGWRSYKLPRVARSSLSAEAQALSHCEQELMYTRLAWYELNGGKVDVKDPASSTFQVAAHIFIDARGVYDTLMKADPGMASFNVKDKYPSLELMGISENLRNQKTVLCWCDSDHQLADGLTKSAKQDIVKKFLLQGHWRLRHPGAFMSAKRRRALDNCTAGRMHVNLSLRV
ncbi:GIP [Symbiodinium sp. CCMP2456]|nr:GIP [Symbiodinium sp. CCMP2456]